MLCSMTQAPQHQFSNMKTLQTLITAIVAVITVSGCSTLPQTTGVMQISPDTYKIVHRAAFGRSIKSQALAMESIRSFCEEKQSQVQIVSSRTLGFPMGDGDLDGAFEAIFKCVK